MKKMVEYCIGDKHKPKYMRKSKNSDMPVNYLRLAKEGKLFGDNGQTKGTNTRKSK
jgi:hypothetical protein